MLFLAGDICTIGTTITLAQFRTRYNHINARLSQLQFVTYMHPSQRTHFNRVYGAKVLQIKCAENRNQWVTINEYMELTTLFGLE